MGCPRHIIHNTAKMAAEAFANIGIVIQLNVLPSYMYVLLLQMIMGLQTEELVVDIYFWFNKSAKRKARLVDYCTLGLCYTEYRQSANK